MSVKINTQFPFSTDHPMQKVHLFPCQHKMELIFAEKRYGKIVDGFCELTGNRCGVCNQEVGAYGSVGEIYSLQMGLERVPYPGIPAVFKLVENDLDETVDSRGVLCRTIGFKSITENSVLEGFELLGYADGTVNIAMKFKSNAHFREYLNSYGVVCNNNDFCISHNVKELRTLFRIISSHNKIPSGELERLTAVVEKGTCDLYQRPKDRPMLF